MKVAENSLACRIHQEQQLFHTREFFVCTPQFNNSKTIRNKFQLAK